MRRIESRPGGELHTPSFPLRVAGLYLVAGLLWILLSDRLLTALVSDPELIFALGVSKGFAFVVLSAGALYWATLRGDRAGREAQAAAQEAVAGRQLLLDTLPHGVLEVDRRGHVLFANRAIQRIFRCPPEALVGRPVEDFFGAQGHEARVRDLFERIVAGGPSSPWYSGVGRTAGGEAVQIRVDWDYRRGPAGELLGLLLVVTEMSAERRAQAELLASQERLGLALELSAVTLVEWRVGSEQLHLSGEWLRQHGFGAREAQGPVSHWLGFLHPIDRQRLIDRLLEGMANAEEPLEMEVRASPPGSSQRFLYMRARVLRDNLGGVIGVLGSFTDLTARREARQEAREATERLHLALEAAEVGIISLDVAGDRLVYDAYAAVILALGTEAGEVPLEEVLQRVNPADRARMRALSAGGESKLDLRVALRGPTGERVIHGRGRVVRGPDGAVQRIDGVVFDATSRRQQEESARLAEAALESIVEGIIVTDTETRVTAVNPALCAMVGQPAAELLGRPVRDIIQEVRPGFDEAREEFFQRGLWVGEAWLRHREGGRVPVRLSVAHVEDEDGVRTHRVAVASDLTASHASQERLDFLTHHDGLTRLPNRRRLEERVAEALGRARRYGLSLGVVHIDLDRFQSINASLGYAAGDQLLVSAATRICQNVREIDTVARVGSDEFAVLVDCLREPAELAEVARRLLAAFNHPFYLPSQAVYLSPALGLSFYPRDGEEAASLLAHADRAMSRSKQLGRNTFAFYSADMNQGVLETLQLASGLREALDREELFLVYQPVTDVATGRTFGVEALLRWAHPELGLVPPARFIPVAEETGLITDIGEWVLETACRQAMAWRAEGLPELRVAVNLSIRQLRDEGLVDRVSTVLSRTGLDAHLLELEVTESMVMGDPTRSRRILERLSGLGLSLAVDDFGTGYSSLSYLRLLPLDVLKVDRSFVAGLPEDNDVAAITRAILGMARCLGLSVIAEGVETEAQLRFLREEGCQQAQGYLLSPPVSHGDIAARLRREMGSPGAAP